MVRPRASVARLAVAATAALGGPMASGARAGRVAGRAGAGADTRSFGGVLAGHRFGPGAHTLPLRATGSAGTGSPDATIAFTIGRG